MTDVYFRVPCELCESVLPVHSKGVVRKVGPDGEGYYICLRCVRKLIRLGLVAQDKVPEDPPAGRIIDI